MTLTRRAVLRGGAALAVAGSLPATAVDADPALRAGLRAVARALFPHPALADAEYTATIDALLARTAEEPGLLPLLTEGITGLEAMALAPLAEVPPAVVTAVLRNIRYTPFFATVRGHVVNTLYDRPSVWKALGYPGPSWPEGYLQRGFDDIDWLPEP